MKQKHMDLLQQMDVKLDDSNRRKKRKDKVSIQDLLESDQKGEQTNDRVKEELVKLAKKKKVEKVNHQQESKVARQQNLKQVVKQVEKWNAAVKEMKNSKQLDFTDKVKLGKRFKGEYIDKSDSFGNKVEQKLKKLKMDSEQNVVQQEREQIENLDLDSKETQRRLNLIKKQREIMFQQEVENKRLNKIKSKLYRKIKNKQKGKENVEGGNIDEMMEERAKERMSLKHKTQNKYVKQLIRYGGDKKRVQSAVQDLENIRKGVMSKYEKEEGETEEEYDDQNFREQAMKEIEDQFMNNDSEDQDKDQQRKGKTFMEKFNQRMKERTKQQAQELYQKVKDGEDIESEQDDQQQEQQEDDEQIDSEEEDIRDALQKDKKEKEEKKKEEKFRGRKMYIQLNKDDDQDFELNQEQEQDLVAGIDIQKFKAKYNQKEMGELDKEVIEQFEKEQNNFNIVQANDMEKEFMEQKIGEIEEELPEEKEEMKGWGAWTGKGVVEPVVDKEKEKKKKEMLIRQMISKRQDKDKDNVIINEERNKNVTSLLVKKLPYNFKSKEQFNYLNNKPLGQEWNMMSQHSQLIQPKVKMQKGKIIEALRWQDEEQDN